MRSASAIRRNSHVERLFHDLAVIAYERRFGPDDPVPSLPSEEAVAVRRAVPKRVTEYAHARSCARAALADLGRPGAVIPTAPDRSPVWPEGVTGSITHTDSYCLAVVGELEHGRSIGIDAELVGAVDDDADALVLTDRDRRTISGVIDLDLGRSLVFAAKEAVYKAQHPITRSWLDFGDVAACELHVSERGAASSTGTLLLEPTGPAVQQIEWPVTAHWFRREDHVTVGVAVTAAG